MFCHEQPPSDLPGGVAICVVRTLGLLLTRFWVAGKSTEIWSHQGWQIKIEREATGFVPPAKSRLNADQDNKPGARYWNVRNGHTMENRNNNSMSDKDDENDINKINSPFKSISTNTIFIIGAILFLVGLILGGSRLDEEPSFFTSLCTFLAFIIYSLGGVFVIARKEAPRSGLTSIKGIGAVFIGIFR